MNQCVCCGDEIPEGRMVCPKCEYDGIDKVNNTQYNNECNISWLELAIHKFKQSKLIHTISENMTIGEFIEKWGIR